MVILSETVVPPDYGVLPLDSGSCCVVISTEFGKVR